MWEPEDARKMPGHQAPSAKEWNEHKETIIRLYIKNKMSLNRVMGYMRSEHQFHAS